MELVLQSHRRIRNREFWRKLYCEKGLTGLHEWYGKGADYKAVLKNENLELDEKTGEKAQTGNDVVQLGNGVAEMTELLFEELQVKSINVVADEVHVEWGKNRHSKRPTISWNAPSPNEGPFPIKLAETSVDWIIDCGSLDQLCMTTAQETVREAVSTYFDKALEALRPQGKLILVTMGHDPVVAEFLRYFSKEDYTFTAYPIGMNGVHDCCTPIVIVVAKTSSTVNQDYAVICFDMRSAQSKNLITTTESIYQLPKFVKMIRRYTFWEREMSDYKPGHLHFFDLVSVKGEAREVQYSLTAYDRTLPSFDTATARSKFVKGLKATIAILVPVADQHHWLYKTKRGHQRLADRAGCRRVLCVFLPDFGLLRGSAIHPVDTVNQIKNDIGRHLIDLSVDKTQPVLLMTQQEKYEDERQEVARDDSVFAGQIFVFDTVVDVEDEEFKETNAESPNKQVNKPPKPSKYMRRAMIFECNPRMAQSEGWYKRRENEVVFDYFHVCHAYHLLMLGGIFADVRIPNEKKEVRGALIGLGGGMFAMLIHSILGDRLHLDTVELDGTVAKIAENHFGYQPGERSHLHVADGAVFIQNKAKSDAASYDFVILDINCTQGEIGGDYHGVSCPPISFLSKEVLTAAAQTLKPTGCLIVNTVSHTAEGREAIVSRMKTAFSQVVGIKYSEDLNEILICCNGEPREYFHGLDEVRNILVKAAVGAPELHKVINKTPLYLSKRAVFETSLTIW